MLFSDMSQIPDIQIFEAAIVTTVVELTKRCVL